VRPSQLAFRIIFSSFSLLSLLPITSVIEITPFALHGGREYNNNLVPNQSDTITSAEQVFLPLLAHHDSTVTTNEAARAA
jgi:hypothetical protein